MKISKIAASRWLCWLLVLFSTAVVAQPAGQAEIVAARQALEQQIAAQPGPWHLGEQQNWKLDLNEGTLVFQIREGVSAVAPVQLIGSYHKVQKVFVWGWDHPLAPEPLRAHAQLAKAWGAKLNRADFTARSQPCSEDEAWNFAALTHQLAGSKAVFRGPSGVAYLFLTVGEIKLLKP